MLLFFSHPRHAGDPNGGVARLRQELLGAATHRQQPGQEVQRAVHRVTPQSDAGNVLYTYKVGHTQTHHTTMTPH